MALKLRTYIPKHVTKSTNSKDSQLDIELNLKNFAMMKFNKSLEELAPVYFKDLLSSEAELNEDGTVKSEGITSTNQRDVGNERALTRWNNFVLNPEDKFDDTCFGLCRYGIRDLLHSADAFVLPTRGEGWGLPIAEAMAMAMTGNIGGYYEYVLTPNPSHIID